MNECTEIQAFKKLSGEVKESEAKITLSSISIKGQSYLLKKLREYSERQEEVCSFLSQNNEKLVAEIKQAEHEIQSLRSAYDAIRSANVELRKELLLARENKVEIEEHVRQGEKKYEDLWLESKSRYESIPYVQKLLQAKNTAQMLGDNIIALQNEADNLVKSIDARKEVLMNLDREHIIEIANFFVKEMPIMLNVVKDKSSEIKKITREIDEIAKERKLKKSQIEKITAPIISVNKVVSNSVDLNISNPDNNWPHNEPLVVLKFNPVNTDFDALSAKLDQIKTKKVEMLQTSSVKRTVQDETTIYKRPKKLEENTPYYFSKPATIEKSNNDIEAKSNFSNRKLINILEDIKLDKNDTYKLVSKVDLENLKDINAIAVNNDASSVEDKEAAPMESEQIEEIDITGTNSGNIVVPPTQFMDFTQKTPIRTSQHAVAESEDNYNNYSFQSSQENVKKRVSFDLPSSVQITSVDDDDGDNDDDGQNVEAEANKTVTSELNMSGVSDDGFKRIKDMILKKHNLDLSPQFVYGKNNSTNMGRAIHNEQEYNTTSKFFQQPKASDLNVLNSEATQPDEINTNNKIEDIEMQTNKEAKSVVEEDENIVAYDTKMQSHEVGKSTSGFLFKHGTQGIPDSLNVSLSTTGYDDGDFPHCFDSSLLLSPKADNIPMTMSGEKAEALPQEDPNFLSGLRKTALSFFGCPTAQETNSDNNEQNTTNNFNFNFGGDDKKNRGGLFSMFR